MKLLSIAIAAALVGVYGGPALASECPKLQMQMERHVNNRLDNAGYMARESMKQGAALHAQGKHAESEAKYEEAAKAAGVKLDRKK